MGRGRDRHDQSPGGQARARGPTVLRHPGARHRLRLLASGARCGHGGRQQRDPASQRRPVAADHPNRRAGSDRGPPVLLRPRARNGGADASPPDPGSDPQATVALAGTVGPTQDRRVGPAMLKLLVVGSVALDTVKTPFGEQHDVLGGSAAFFATAASYFTPVSLIAVVGKDFPEVHLKFLQMRGIDLTGLERRPGKTFRWRGEYSHQLNEARTLETHLNVFETFRPQIPETYRSPDLLFLANIDPELQHTVLQQVKRPRLVACDTMNFWIEGKRSALLRLLKEVDVLIINDGEARALGGDPNLVKVARTIRMAGPSTLIVKRGEYGVLLFSGERIFAAPAFPLEQVKDPTGAGDCFAGGFMGFLASTGNLSEEAFCRAVIFGSVMASFAVEEFSLDRLRQLAYKEIEDRFKAFKRLTFFENIYG